MSQTPSRDRLPAEMTWDLTTIFASDAAWEAELKAVQGAEATLLPHQGHLGDSPATLATVIQSRDELYRRLEKLYVYAHLHSDEDTANSHYSGLQDRIRSHWATVSAALSWIEPEIVAIPDARLDELGRAPDLQPYRRFLDVLRQDKPHTLSAPEERLLAMAAEPLAAPQKAFTKLTNADLEFPLIEDAQGTPVRLTQGNYVTFLESRDRAVRQRAFEGIYDTFGKVKNTLAATLDGNVRKHLFQAKARRFPSALAASLHKDRVDETLYRSLIEAIHRGLPAFHRYLDLRRRMLGLDKLDMWDLHVPFVPAIEVKVPYSQACEWTLAAMAPLGEAYVDIVRQGLSDRWIDVLECKGKRSGAYSSGCFDTNPFILLNHQDNLNSAFTLVHELGHSLHSYQSNRNQPHLYADYSIVVAEVASITNEALLWDYLYRTTGEPRFKAYLLNHLCDEFRTTVFRQVMFAEYELLIHEKAEGGVALTTDELCRSYYELNATYHGDVTAPDERIALEWARIPHFYYNFYVYKYATGFAAAQAFAKRLLSGDAAARDGYLGFLRAGSSQDPLDILAAAGVDLRQPAVIAQALERFAECVTELESVLGG